MPVTVARDARDAFSREEFLTAWRLIFATILSENEIADIVDQFLTDRAWVLVGDLIGALAIQSTSARERARMVWGDDADASAERVRAILHSRR